MYITVGGVGNCSAAANTAANVFTDLHAKQIRQSHSIGHHFLVGIVGVSPLSFCHHLYSSPHPVLARHGKGSSQGQKDWKELLVDCLTCHYNCSSFTT